MSKAARENVRNGPKFAKTVYLNIDNGPSKLWLGTALVLSSDILVLKIILVLVFIQFWGNNFYFSFSFSFEIILVSISVSVLK